MKTRPMLTVVICLLAALTLPVLLPGQTSSNSSFPSLTFVRDPDCSTHNPNLGIVTLDSPADTLLFESRQCNRIIAPDGHQVTLGEFLSVQGTATAQCTMGGTEGSVQLSGLFPNGLYSVWLFKLAASGKGVSTAGIGSLGLNDGSENVVLADASGNAQLSATNPAGRLSIYGITDACWLSDTKFSHQLMIVYHIDGMSHGRVPGPNGAFIEQFVFEFDHK